MTGLETFENLAPAAIPATVFTASLLGSLHCAGMCGPIQQAAAPRAGHYHAGRLFAYVALGAAAGALGESLLERVQNPAFALAAGLVFALTLLAIGVSTIRGGLGRHGLAFKFLNRAWAHAFRLKDARVRSLALGLLTPLLPCAWLYTFLAGAALTESPLWGAAFMGAFGAGTLPAFGLLPAAR
ncbi:MAG TPA: sulfite exporter TauE/SafE family protein, partial [Bdellovibrionales bacterium]|nr:sulfite exporter TauE/SafE family protein [Bdellovibrionales bacterium]